ncbi:MAG: hypothetical protein U9Q97_03320 [Acidobacteriota bacterium]|nr:hypothetical protein [Acidobacteriota bacterium]
MVSEHLRSWKRIEFEVKETDRGLQAVNVKRAVVSGGERDQKRR